MFPTAASISSISSLTGSDSVNFIDDDKRQQVLPKVAESNWWFKFFFYSEPVLSNARRKDLSASGHWHLYNPVVWDYAYEVKTVAKDILEAKKATNLVDACQAVKSH
ncbi:pancreatic progenitor cell differentiation and proliferation factor-like protein [Equus przewalskii]|uniref:Pancreatic progenitor cell differentiation and proliferation factor-like protein n=1 Tax=Equus przewalskii TaxID=9798 RepID=A0ABM2FR23_EQUPR